MGYKSHSWFPRRTFALVFLSVIVAGTQVGAQTERDAARSDCTDPSCPKINGEFAFENGPEEDNELGSRTAPAEPIQPQLAPKNKRLFWVLPNYLFVENLDKFDRLSTQSKFKLTARTMSDPVTVTFIGGIALIGQARNSDPSYGQGLKGYGKRYITQFADTGIGTLMTASVFPTVLHQDPRYFQLGSGGAWRRVKYSISRIFLTRTDSGSAQFNYSEILGTAVAAGISNTYHPQDQRTFSNTMNVWGTNIGLNMICNVAKEFWPDIRSKFGKQKPPI
jgi:hypothetical protein